MGDLSATAVVLQRFIILISLYTYYNNHNNLHGVVYTCTVGVSGVLSHSIQKELTERILSNLLKKEKANQEQEEEDKEEVQYILYTIIMMLYTT